ncbi:MAG TPA: porin family protein [Puia sp.]|nr:porin family protein [Puia sp.]
MNRSALLRCVFLIGALFPIIEMNAQFSLGAKGGVSIPNLTNGGSENNPLNTGYSSRVGADFALFGEYSFSSLFSLEAGLEYSSQGGKKNGNQALPVPSQLASMFPPGEAPPYLWADFNQEAKLNYLMIPVLAKFTFYPGGPWQLYVDAGPFVGFLVSAKTVASGNGNVYADQGETQPLLPGPISFNQTEDIKDSLRSTNEGVEGNVGVAYILGQGRIFLEAGGNYGFANIQKNADDGQNRTGAATVRIGYAYSFGSKPKSRHAVQSPKTP